MFTMFKFGASSPAAKDGCVSRGEHGVGAVGLTSFTASNKRRQFDADTRSKKSCRISSGDGQTKCYDERTNSDHGAFQPVDHRVNCMEPVATPGDSIQYNDENFKGDNKPDNATIKSSSIAGRSTALSHSKELTPGVLSPDAIKLLFDEEEDEFMLATDFLYTPLYNDLCHEKIQLRFNIEGNDVQLHFGEPFPDVRQENNDLNLPQNASPKSCPNPCSPSLLRDDVAFEGPPVILGQDEEGRLITRAGQGHPREEIQIGSTSERCEAGGDTSGVQTSGASVASNVQHIADTDYDDNKTDKRDLISLPLEDDNTDNTNITTFKEGVTPGNSLSVKPLHENLELCISEQKSADSREDQSDLIFSVKKNQDADYEKLSSHSVPIWCETFSVATKEKDLDEAWYDVCEDSRSGDRVDSTPTCGPEVTPPAASATRHDRDVVSRCVVDIVRSVLTDQKISEPDTNITINIKNITVSPSGELEDMANVIRVPLQESAASAHGETEASLNSSQKRRRGTEDGCQYYDLFFDYEIWHFQMVQEKNKLYKAKLNKEETCKWQQFKILRKTHETHLQDKQCLIQSLQDIIQEQEARITELEAQCKGVPCPETSCDTSLTSSIKTLVQQIMKLQQEKSDMQLLLLNHEGDVKRDEIAKLKDANGRLEAEKKQMQEEMMKVLSKQGSSISDMEKILKKELENDKLQEELRISQNSVSRLQGQIEVIISQKDEAEHNLQKLREENTRLHVQLESALSDLRQHDYQKAAAEVKYKECLARLNTEKDRLSEQVDELTLKLKQAQEQPTLLSSMKSERDHLAKEVEDLSATCQEVNKQLAEERNRASDLEEKLSSMNEIKSERDQLSAAVKQLTEKCEHSNELLQSQRNKVTDLEQQVNLYKNEIANLHTRMAGEIQVLQKAKLEEMEEFKEQYEASCRDQRERLGMLKINLHDTHKCMMAVIKEHRKLKELCLKFPEWSMISIQEIGTQVKQAIQDISAYNVELVKKYRKEMKLRKKYHNELVELKGKIRVFCRVRPYIREDGSGPQAEYVISYDKDDDALLSVLHRGRTQTFELDKVFSSESTQEQVYAEVQSLVVSCIDGYNVCIFAYGQTGSGKTYTMEGTLDNPGINQRALQDLFRETADRCQDWDFTITVSFLEIYNETLRDLLSDDPLEKLEIKMSPEGGLYVPGQRCYEVQSVDDIKQVFEMGQRNRATATTNMNEHSSRSHALLCVSVTGENRTTGARTLGRLNLVDLAGSERVSKSGAEGARFKEAQNINKSLSTLGDVIHALRKNQSHIPYRNSKLTYLLHDSLGGESKTLMIVQVAPVNKNVAETIASLAFAQRVRAK